MTLAIVFEMVGLIVRVARDGELDCRLWSVSSVSAAYRGAFGGSVIVLRSHDVPQRTFAESSCTDKDNRISMPSKKVDFDVVREIAMALPDVEESTIHGVRSLKVRGTLLTSPALHKSAEPNSLAVRIGCDQRAELMAAEPRVYYVTDHYANYPTVLVRMSQIHRDSLRDLLGTAWLFVSAKTRRGKRQVRKQRASPAAPR